MFRTLFAALVAAIGLVFALAGTARADAEFCPAYVSGAHVFGSTAASTSGKLVAVQLAAASQRRVSGEVVVEGQLGWYRLPFSKVALSPSLEHLRGQAATYDRMTYHSEPIYVELPDFDNVVQAWVSEASSEGDAEYGWDARGAVTCAPAPAWETARDLVALAQPPKPSDPVVLATRASIPEGFNDCATPFAEATLVTAATPRTPRNVQLDSYYELGVAVAIDTDGKPLDAWIYEPSGVPELDEAVIAAAKLSKYSPGIALCKPAPGVYLFSGTFGHTLF